MNKPIEFLVRHGVAVLFGAVFVEQVGIPMPAVIWLLPAGALIADGRLHWLAALAAAVLGSILADVIWYCLGRRYGNKVLGLLCRISLEPDSCVRRTQDVFARHGVQGIVAAKFVPGLSTLAPPLAGSSGVSAPRFLFFDGLGSVLYVGTFLLAGVLFSHQLDQVLTAMGNLGSGALTVVAALVALYIGYKYFQRRRLLHQLRMARITVDELHKKLADGEHPVILDLRSKSALADEPEVIQGAVHIVMDEVERRQQEIPRDREIIVYCSCPNEVSSARVALLLQKKGYARVRPLLGGLDAWRARQYPTEAVAFRSAAQP